MIASRSPGWTGRPERRDRRRGKALVLFAMMLPVMVGGMGLSIDTGIIGTSRSQLWTTTDAAALAGAMQLVGTESARENLLRGADRTADFARARSKALEVGRSNRVLNDAPDLRDNPSNSSSGDVVIGYAVLPMTHNMNTDPALSSLFNSVQVTAQRNAERGGKVDTPFAAVFGYDGVDVSVSSTATVENFPIKGFKQTSNANTNLLPIVLDEPTYKVMIGEDTSQAPRDDYTYNPSDGSVSNGSDGIGESVLYGPKKAGIPGNWGTVKIGVSNNSTKTLGDQIRYGITPEQLANMGGVIQLDPTTGTLILDGNPGLSAGIKDDLEAIKGNPVTIPIYRDSGGNGNNAWYEIVRFAGVRIVKVQLTGRNKHVIVQPALLFGDPGVIPDTDNDGPDPPPWSQGGVVRLHLSR